MKTRKNLANLEIKLTIKRVRGVAVRSGATAGSAGEVGKTGITGDFSSPRR